MSDQTVAQRIRDWDEWVEDGNDPEGTYAAKPFDAGIMLAVARVLESWDQLDPNHGDLAEAVRMLQETAEEVIQR